MLRERRNVEKKYYKINNNNNNKKHFIFTIYQILFFKIVFI